MPDVMLAAQWDSIAGSGEKQDIGERRLMVAMLLNAALELRRNRRDAITAGTRRWIESDDRAPFCFLWLCEQLGLNAARLREQLRHPETLAPGRDLRRHPSRRSCHQIGHGRIYQRRGGRQR
jgi:hypothetical protein